jgi:hypothetical protein
VPPVSGWYPDPTGRFEYRYHNDREWTSDVSTGGRRFIDSLDGGGPAPTPTPVAAGGNGIALAGMVCGIVAVITSWVPFVGVVGLIVAVVGLALSIPALARSRPSGHRRGFAIAGIVTSSLGVLFGILGIALSVLLFRAVERFDQPGANEARITDCSTQEDGTIVATGEIDNLSADERDYTVLVELAPGVTDRVAVQDVAPGATAEFTARGNTDRFSRTTTGTTAGCSVSSVDGPVPFGLDPDLFE